VLEPIQSRCAVLRYSKLTDTQLLTRLTEVCTSENVSYTDDGLEAVIFTAQGDMRQVHLQHYQCLIEYSALWCSISSHAKHGNFCKLFGTGNSEYKSNFPVNSNSNFLSSVQRLGSPIGWGAL